MLQILNLCVHNGIRLESIRNAKEFETQNREVTFLPSSIFCWNYLSASLGL